LGAVILCSELLEKSSELQRKATAVHKNDEELCSEKEWNFRLYLVIEN
jgi:hypothetical protein